MKLIWLGHSAFRVELGSSVLLFDPFLTENPQFTGSFEEATRDATHVLLTHGHDDHIGDAARIARERGAEIVAKHEICMFLAEQGAEKLNPGNTGGVADCGEFRVSFTDARHSSGAVADGRSIYLGNPNGLIVEARGEPALYHMGDTGIFGDMALIAELYRPKIGLIPVGGRFTMDGRMAAMAARRYFDFATAIPCHYGTFPIIDKDASAFVEAMQGASARVLIPKIGERVSL